MTFLATLDAYRRNDFDRLGELYAPDVEWRAVDPGQSCQNRNDVFEMFRANMGIGLRLTFEDIRGIGPVVIVTARANDSPPMTSVFHVENGQIVDVEDYMSRADAEAAVFGTSAAG